MKYRLGEEVINEIMMLLGGKTLKISPKKEGQIDFTSLGALKYELIQIIILIMNVKWLKRTSQ